MRLKKFYVIKFSKKSWYEHSTKLTKPYIYQKFDYIFWLFYSSSLIQSSYCWSSNQISLFLYYFLSLHHFGASLSLSTSCHWRPSNSSKNLIAKRKRFFTGAVRNPFRWSLVIWLPWDLMGLRRGWVSCREFDCWVLWVWLWVSSEKNWYGFVVGFGLSVKKELKKWSGFGLPWVRFDLVLLGMAMKLGFVVAENWWRRVVGKVGFGLSVAVWWRKVGKVVKK